MKTITLILLASTTLATTPIEKEAYANIVVKKEAQMRRIHSDHTLLEKRIKDTENNLKEILQKYQEVISQNRMLNQRVIELEKNNKVLWNEVEKSGDISDDLAKKFGKKTNVSRMPASIKVKK